MKQKDLERALDWCGTIVSEAQYLEKRVQDTLDEATDPENIQIDDDGDRTVNVDGEGLDIMLQNGMGEVLMAMEHLRQERDIRMEW